MIHKLFLNNKVVSHGRDMGAAGITLKLIGDKSETSQSVVSEKQGEFSFKKVVPGMYRIIASHPELKFKSNEARINVQSDSVTVSEGLVVLGYPVQGRVVSEGEPIQNVIFSLYSSNEDATSHCGLSAPSAPSPIPEDSDLKLVCQTSSDLKGEFRFPVVQPGHYKLVPLYQGENIRFDIKPSVTDFDVEDGAVVMSQTFEVLSTLFFKVIIML